ncbi:MAG: hypothetical protein EXR52_07210, partial [Dehalococcoidia bacterium]|nr:hypothetical protein [Dehalococcoidia bacterium]
MADDTTLTAAEPDLEALLHEEYHVDPDWYVRTELSWDLALRDRLCHDARSGKTASEPRRAVRGAAGGVRFQRKAGKDYSSDPIAAIQDMCADAADYRDAALPLKEILFRLLLAGGNQPLTVLSLYDSVMEWVNGGD